MSTNGENNVIVEVAAHEPEPERMLTLRRVLIAITAITVLILLGGQLLDRPDYDSKTVPEFLVGDWTSDHPEYSDRYLTMKATSITFGTGGTSSVKYEILGVQMVQIEGVDTIVLHFQDPAGTRFKRSVVLDPSREQMHFAGQTGVVWRRIGT